MPGEVSQSYNGPTDGVCICGHDVMSHFHLDGCDQCACADYIEREWLEEYAADFGMMPAEVEAQLPESGDNTLELNLRNSDEIK